ncbi:MAG: GIY-YIG nuclease family protein, partial [Desulfobacterales bacterium]|nr:GIY-YIG nuclease family protein [Desulfobacterales bacterium]
VLAIFIFGKYLQNRKNSTICHNMLINIDSFYPYIVNLNLCYIERELLLGSQTIKGSISIEPYFTGVSFAYWVYIIQSQSTGRHYCGYSDNVDRRVSQHNDPQYRLTRTTKAWKGPWRVLWTEECNNRADAVTLERKIKKRGIGRYLRTHSAESR